MNCTVRSRAWAVVFLSSGLIASAMIGETRGLDNFWDGSVNNSWHNVGNWHFVGPITPLPRVPSDIDTAVLGAPAGDSVVLDGDTAPINGLLLGAGIQLSTNGHQLHVDDGGSAITSIAGGATLLVERPSGTLFRSGLDTDQIFMLSSGELLLAENGLASVSDDTTIRSGSLISNNFNGGGGSIQFGGDLLMDDATLDLANGPVSMLFNTRTKATAQNGSVLHLPTLQLPNNQHLELNSGSTANISGNTRVGLASSLEIVDSTFNSSGNVTVTQSASFRLADDQGSSTFLLPTGGMFTAAEHADVMFERSISVSRDQVYSINSGADLVSPSAIFVGAIGSVGELIASGNGTTLDVNQLTVGRHSAGTSEVTLSDSAAATLNSLSLSSGFLAGNTDPVEARMTIESNASVELNSLFFGPCIGCNGGPAGGFGNLTLRTGGSLSQSGTAGTVLGSDFATNGTLSVTSGASYTSNTGNFNIHDKGTLTVGGGTNPGRVEINGPLDVGGRIFSSGTFDVNASMTIDGGEVNLSLGEMTADAINLAGGGVFNFTGGRLSVGLHNGNLTNNGGTLAPGASAGSSTIAGDYAQLAGSTLDIELGGAGMGTDYDFVDVAGNAAVDGDLLLALLDGFLPSAADTFTVLDASSLAGIFDNISNGGRLDTVDGRGSFQVNYGPASVFNPDQIVLSDFEAALLGDYDNDGLVGQGDLDLVLLNWGHTVPPDPVPTGWVNQQPNGVIGQEALDDVLLNWGNSTLSTLAVPEPATSGLLSVASIVVATRRRRSIVSQKTR